ncbi:MAG: hypothetical protein IPK50_14580 [Fibrobacterota bacterium]|nr:MAG: hypothetical protein IPK50_14580 [Fibrobacterota bacterium]
MKRIFKSWAIEIVWAGGWILLCLIYFVEKISIRCEQCIDLRNCPPCETGFMTNFWIYMALFNAIIVGSMIIRRSIRKFSKNPDLPAST